MTLLGDHDDMAPKRSDSPWLGGHAPIFRTAATESIRPLVDRHAEFLELNVVGAEEKLFVMNVTTVVPALDEERSVLMRFPHGALMHIRRHVFLESKIEVLPVFKIPNLRCSPVFFSGEFVDHWTDAGFVGLAFDEVWRSQSMEA